jgi:hypothetical protein
MAARDRLRRLEKAMGDELSHFELQDGKRFYFEPEEVSKSLVLFWADSMRADYRREPRPEPPEVFRAVADARDREKALSVVLPGPGLLPVDRGALIERGEILPRSFVAGREYEAPLEVLESTPQDGQRGNR